MDNFIPTSVEPIASYATTKTIDKINTWDTLLKAYTKDADTCTALEDEHAVTPSTAMSGSTSLTAPVKMNAGPPLTTTTVPPNNSTTEAQRQKLHMLNWAQQQAHDIVEKMLQQTITGT